MPFACSPVPSPWFEDGQNGILLTLCRSCFPSFCLCGGGSQQFSCMTCPPTPQTTHPGGWKWRGRGGHSTRAYGGAK